MQSSETGQTQPKQQKFSRDATGTPPIPAASQEELGRSQGDPSRDQNAVNPPISIPCRYFRYVEQSQKPEQLLHCRLSFGSVQGSPSLFRRFFWRRPVTVQWRNDIASPYSGAGSLEISSVVHGFAGAVVMCEVRCAVAEGTGAFWKRARFLGGDR